MLAATHSAAPGEFLAFFRHAQGDYFSRVFTIHVEPHALPRGSYALAALPIALFALACGTLRDLTRGTVSLQARRTRTAELDTLLRLGSLLLILGTLMTYAIRSRGVATFAWPDEQTRAAAETIPRTSAIVGALLWSVLLAVI